jgi:uncharacterized OB-fold protein
MKKIDSAIKKEECDHEWEMIAFIGMEGKEIGECSKCGETYEYVRGNCPFCDAEHGYNSGWGFSPEGWAEAEKNHNENH